MPSTAYERAAYEYARDRIGRPVRTAMRANEDESIVLPVNVVADSPIEGLTSYYTIGLGQYKSGLTAQSGRPLRFEFTFAARADQPFALDGFSNAAIDLASGDYSAKPGFIYPDVFADYDPEVTTLHGMLWYPLTWSEPFEGAVIEGLEVEWLQVLPITNFEADWVRSRGGGYKGEGTEALIDAFEAQRPEIYDLKRPSVLLPA